MSEMRSPSAETQDGSPFPGAARVLRGSVEGSADALQAHLRALSPDLTVQPASDVRAMRVDSHLVVTDGARLWRNGYSAAAEMSCQYVPEDLVIFAPASGGFHPLTRPAKQVKPGEVFCCYPARPGKWLIPEGAVIDGVVLPGDLIIKRLNMMLGRVDGKRLEFTPVLDAESSAARAIRSAVKSMIAITEDRNLNLKGAAIKSLATAILDLSLEAIPNSFTERLRCPPPQVSPHQVRRAINFIQDRPMPVLPIAELAAICGVGERSLHYTFQNFVGMTPAEYWRRVRIGRALEELRANPSLSMSSVAVNWGFTNVTRFRALCTEFGAEAVARTRIK